MSPTALAEGPARPRPHTKASPEDSGRISVRVAALAGIAADKAAAALPDITLSGRGAARRVKIAIYTEQCVGGALKGENLSRLLVSAKALRIAIRMVFPAHAVLLTSTQQVHILAASSPSLPKSPVRRSPAHCCPDQPPPAHLPRSRSARRPQTCTSQQQT